MKKYAFLLMACLVSVSLAAQNTTSQSSTTTEKSQQASKAPRRPGDPGYNDPYHHGDAHYGDHHHHGDPHYNDPHHHHPTPPPAPRVANDEQVRWALQVLNKQSYDDKRMEVARLCVVLCPFPVRDLSRMAGCFTMEDRKVDFLKFAYRYCPDPENYYRLRDVLRYRSDYDKLMESVDPHYRRPY